MHHPGPWTLGRLQELLKSSPKSGALATCGTGHAGDGRVVKTAAVCPTEGEPGATRSEEAQRVKRPSMERRGMGSGGDNGLARNSGRVSKDLCNDSDDDRDDDRDDREEEDDNFDDGGDDGDGESDASDEVSVDLELVDDVTCDEGFELGEVSTVHGFVHVAICFFCA